MNRDKLLAILSCLKPEDVEQLKQILAAPAQSAEAGSDGVVGFDSTRTRITENQHFEIQRTEIIEENGEIGRIKSFNVLDCGHSQLLCRQGGVDSFGHVVCEHCLRWCDRGNHPCCVLDSKLLSSGARACDNHRGLKRFFVKPTFKRPIEK